MNGFVPFSLKASVLLEIDLCVFSGHSLCHVTLFAAAFYSTKEVLKLPRNYLSLT
jgi:hypothetical protein